MVKRNKVLTTSVNYSGEWTRNDRHIKSLVLRRYLKAMRSRDFEFSINKLFNNIF